METSDENYTFDELVDIIGTQITRLRNNLPGPLVLTFDAKQLSAPHLACVLVGSLHYRVLEAAEDAFTLLAKRNLVGSALLTRAVLESAITLGALRHRIENRHSIPVDELRSKIEELTFGSRIINGSNLEGILIPKTKSILSHLEKFKNVESAAEDNYDFMSELAHPNSASVMGIFCRFDQENSLTVFGRNHQNIELLSVGVGMNLTYSLRVFEDECLKTRQEASIWLNGSDH